MKKTLAIAALLMLAASASALRNPAAVYCEALGNAYVVEHAADGDTGYCMVRGNATKVDAWQFLQGKAAAVDVSLDGGHVVLLGFRPQWRDQSFGTFRVVFNSVLYTGAR